MKKILLIIIIAILILTTGCWDMVEINQRIFPYSIGVDLNHDEGEDYILTISYLNINAIGKNATQQERVFVVSIPATSIFEGTKKMSHIVQYPFYFKHIRALIIGEELANDSHRMREILDGLSRDYVINKKLLIATAEGKAEDVLKSVPKATKQEVIEGTVYTLLNNTGSSVRYRSKPLTDFIQGMDQGAVIVPRIKVENNDLKVFGGCIIKDYEVVGHIGEVENRGITFLVGEVKTGIIDAPYNDATLSYEITGQNMKRKLIKGEKNLKFKIDIETQGSLQEYIIRDKPEIDGEEKLKNMEKSIKEVMEKEINHTLEVLQKEHKADVIGVREYISKFHPKIWKEVSQDWDEVFSEMEIEVNVTPRLRRVGLIK
ncbi:Ger(x)C family spore germination protein [Tissierella sp.]|uniref:Ger(x)C family spore germination protein n=1 Tax=Tissierella sp. TaxID=41274 RepID=UPI002859D780|nr:Ger(x)C family spore germination protein [Tissierella sp.]MDR7857580.1 Ger(x)C family spore germination protein [Tissierella sp.]